MQKVILLVLDGFGEGPDYEGNAVKRANTPYIDSLNEKYPHVLLKASGNAVGLPEIGQGASEPGHLTMGAGRVVWQPYEEINKSIEAGDFFHKPDLVAACAHVKMKNSALHLMGLFSDGGVHSHIDHIVALLDICKEQGIENVYIHAFGDGRDVPEKSIEGYITTLEKAMKEKGVGKLASVIGRYYAMDRDRNWDRTKVAYDLLVHGKGEECPDMNKCVDDYYAKTEREEATDYYLAPYKTPDFQPIKEDDSVIFFNFRSDRARQLTHAFVDKEFEHFEATLRPKFVCMGPYSDEAPVVFPPQEIVNNLSTYLSDKGLKQLKIAETEKYAHVTYFFNSQVEEPKEGEDRILVPSQKVPSYAELPEMSAAGITSKVMQAIEEEKYDFILVNYANPDLVGHSGVLEAAIKACEVMDNAVKSVVETALEHGYEIIMTADHGNAERMIYEDNGKPCPSHTTNPVNCIVISDKDIKLKEGMSLSGIAPTILQMMGIDKPEEMTGESMIS